MVPLQSIPLIYTQRQNYRQWENNLCFQINGKYSQASKCVKSRIMTKVIDYVIYIDKFEQNCVALKGMLQTLRLKDHMKNIGIDQSLINSAIFEHICLKPSMC